ncbi:class I mannose-6-phosphate isomerase [Lysinimonas soli]|uniref:Class I mannose-6-phosphate isomerase n=1 Tax=Lysinimonas soli TaxID=1074233 RepID=A0ABW0NMZ4_9MICO
MTAEPIRLPANQPADRFYAGGEHIARFRHSATPADPFTPEDWIASTTSVRGHAPTGLTRLPDGRMLSEAIAQDPVAWLGPEHVARFGPDAMLLVKLLDAGQRLPVHAHPHRDFAARHLGTAHGKAEAWYILSPGVVYLGLREGIDPARLRALVDAQDTSALLALMNRVEVDAHDTVYVPPGTLHAIGGGVLLAEVQEPEDLSILLEWNGFAIDGATEGHLGLGFDLALAAVTTEPLADGALSSVICRGAQDGPALPPASIGYFRLDRIASPRVLPAGFAIVIGLTDGLTLSTRAGATTIDAGATILVPAAAGDLSFDGQGSALVARPPQA